MDMSKVHLPLLYLTDMQSLSGLLYLSRINRCITSSGLISLNDSIVALILILAAAATRAALHVM
jgi:hypothetical protein